MGNKIPVESLADPTLDSRIKSIDGFDYAVCRRIFEMRKVWLILPVMVLCYIVTLKLNASDEKAQGGNPTARDKALMGLKLSASQKALEGLVSKNFALIEKAGEELKRLDESRLWSSIENPEYNHFRIELKREGDKLIQMANAKNLDGAAFTYTTMVGTCINCHTHCRDVLKIAQFGPDSKVFPIPTNELEDPISLKEDVIRR